MLLMIPLVVLWAYLAQVDLRPDRMSSDGKSLMAILRWNAGINMLFPEKEVDVSQYATKNDR